MKYHSVKKNPDFIGRKYYWQRLEDIDTRAEASVIVVYGRRRIGKTELIEQFYRNRPLLKFEGLQPDRAHIRKGDMAEKRRQLRECLTRLGRYTERPAEYKNISIDRWSDFFELLVPMLEQGEMILYLEEVQWLANYSDDFLSEFKPYWDDILRHNPGLRVVISGSSPSFIVSQFLSSSAMYNRANHMLRLEPFSLGEIRQFLKKGNREVMLAAIAIGGIPEYLKQIKNTLSVYIGLCEKSYRPGEFFRVEKERVFVSSLASNRFYERIIDYLAHHKSATRPQLYKALTKGKSAAPGGSFTEVLDELIALDFVEKYVPITVKNKANSRQARYAIADEYLQFYYRFVDGYKEDIDRGKYIDNPVQAVNRQDFNKLMGFSFERWCRKNEHLIAKCIGFGGVIEYLHGPWYEKATQNSHGVQIDLMYIRKDSRIIVCEIKYNNDSTLTKKVIRDVQEKIDTFLTNNQKYRRYTIETALITTESAPETIKREGFFTYLVTTDEML